MRTKFALQIYIDTKIPPREIWSDKYCPKGTVLYLSKIRFHYNLKTGL